MSSQWLLILAGVVLVAVVIVLAILWRRRRAQAPQPQELGQEPAASLDKRPLFTALRRLGENHKRIYQVPWCLLVGAAGSGRSALLSSLTRDQSAGRPEPKAAKKDGWAFWFLNDGLAIDLVGNAFMEKPLREQLLSYLRMARPRRPLDSVVLTLPVTELLAIRDAKRAQGSTPGLAEPANMAPDIVQELYLALRELHDVLGVSLPIYVVITGTDELVGFQELCRALPADKRDQMFGWSNPHAYQEKYDSEWVRGAIEAIYEDLSMVQLALLARGGEALGDGAERSQLFTFAEVVRELQSPLVGVLDRFFKSNLYEEPLWLRGIYFCGEQKTPGQEAPWPIAFSKELFEKRVFPEWILARPAEQALKRNRQRVGLLKGAVGSILGMASLVMLASGLNLHRERELIGSHLQAVAQRVEDAVHLQHQRRIEQQPSEADLELTRRVLEELGGIDRDDLSRFTLPGSLMSDLDEELRQAMARTFERVVFESLRVKLRARRELLSQELEKELRQQRHQTEPSTSVALASATVPVKEAVGTVKKAVWTVKEAVETVKEVDSLPLMPEFDELSKFLELLKGYDDNSKLHAVLVGSVTPEAKTARVEALEALAQPVLEAALPAAFHQRPELYERWLALARSEPLEPLKGMDTRVKDRLVQLAGNLQVQLFDRNSNLLEQRVRTLEERVTKLQTATVSDQSLQSVATAIREVHHDLDLDSVKWISSDKLDASLVALLKRIEETPFLDPKQAKLLSQEIETRWTTDLVHLQRRLREEYAALNLGPVLLIESDKHLALREPYLTLKQVLEDPVAQTLSQSLQDTPRPLDGEPVRLFWSEEQLDRSLKLVEPYNLFVKLVTDKKFPAEAAEVLSAQAKGLLQARLREQVRQAILTKAAPQPASAGEPARAEITAELDNLKRASSKLLELLNLYQQLGMEDARQDLNQLISFQAAGLLRRTDDLLEQDAPYTPDSRLARWSGERPPALEAFGVSDAQSLATYLQVQRSRVSTLARDQASIPVALLLAVDKESSQPLVTKWQRLLSELEAREKMTPGNSVQVLETFIQTDMMTASSEICTTARSSARTADGGDYFLGRLSVLRDAVRRRCEGFEVVALQQSYEKLADSFNETLAGHFPFSEEVPSGSEGELALKDLRAFVKEFDAFRATLGGASESEGGLRQRIPLRALSQEQVTFLAQLEEARKFLLPLLREGDGPLYSVRMMPRVNRRHELRANQLIEWRLEVAGQRVETAAAWQPETALRVAFRWAKDGPSTPLAEEAPGAQLLATDTLGFDYTGSWSLIRLLRIHHTSHSELGGRKDAQPHTLRFAMLTQPRSRSDGSKGAADPEGVRAFVRLEVFGPDGKTLLVAPSTWPTRAPVK